jgi:hypothetical protein
VRINVRGVRSNGPTSIPSPSRESAGALHALMPNHFAAPITDGYETYDRQLALGWCSPSILRTRERLAIRSIEIAIQSKRARRLGVFIHTIAR